MSYIEETEQVSRPQPNKAKRMSTLTRIFSYVGFALAVGFSTIVILGFLN